MDISLAPTRIDYYQMLGLEPSAPLEAVRGLYRVLARRLHPDVSGDPTTAAAMARANSIYQALVAKPVPSDLEVHSVPILRRSQSGDDALARYRESMATATDSLGQLVDVRA